MALPLSFSVIEATDFLSFLSYSELKHCNFCKQQIPIHSRFFTPRQAWAPSDPNPGHRRSGLAFGSLDLRQPSCALGPWDPFWWPTDKSSCLSWRAERAQWWPAPKGSQGRHLRKQPWGFQHLLPPCSCHQTNCLRRVPSTFPAHDWSQDSIAL